LSVSTSGRNPGGSFLECEVVKTMKRNQLLLLPVIIAFFLIFIPADAGMAASQKQNKPDSSPGKVVLQPKSTIDLAKMSKYDTSGAATVSALAIAKKYYDLALPKIELKLKVDYAILTNGIISFDGKQADEKKALELSSTAACAVINPDSKYFATALSCVAFTKAVKHNQVAHNMAAIINMSELTKDAGINAKADAVAVYEYAVSLNPKNADTLVNLGNVYMDLNRQEDARILFEAALKLVPKYSRAREGMATYGLARGDQKKAVAELKKDQIMLPGYVRKISENSKNITDPKRAPDVTMGDTVDTARAAIDRLKELKAVSTADFIEEFDPVDAQQIRNKINHLPEGDRLHLPKITAIAEVSTYDIYYHKTRKFNGYTDALKAFFKQWAKILEKMERQNLQNMGIQPGKGNVQFTPDMDPAKLKELAKQAQKDAKAGNFEKLQEMMALLDPEQSKTIQPDYGNGNQIETYIKTYNLQELKKKRDAYFIYFLRLCEKYQAILEEDSKVGLHRIKELKEAEAEEIERISKSDADPDVIVAQIKQVNIQYGMQRNEVRQTWFQKSFGMMVYQYINTFKPAMEEMWVDCMPHVRIISDEKSRNKWYADISSIALINSSRFMNLVLAGAAADGQWDDVNGQDLQNAEDELKDALDKGNRDAQENIKSANTPEGLSPEALLDKFSINQSFGPLDVKLIASGIEVTGTLLVKGKLSYDWKHDVLSGGLGVGVKVGADFKGAKGEVGVSTMVTVTINTATGKVSEIDWVGNADLSISAGGVSTGGSYQASVMHGNSFTPALSGAYQQVSVDY
jgi:tetratricopeptide (TPR) repeat protein